MSKIVFPRALKELRIHFCQSGSESAAIRSFVQKSYPALKDANKSTPILIREALGIKPVAYARFEKGREVKADLTGDIESVLQDLVSKGQ